MREGVHPADFPFVNKLRWVKILDLTSKLRLEFGSIKTGNGARTAHTVLQTIPKVGKVITQWRKGPDTSNNYPAELHAKKLLGVFFDVFNRFAYSLNLFSLIIGYGDVEFLFEFHD